VRSAERPCGVFAVAIGLVCTIRCDQTMFVPADNQELAFLQKRTVHRMHSSSTVEFPVWIVTCTLDMV